MEAREDLLDKLANGGLCLLDRRGKEAAGVLQRERKIHITDIGGNLYACLAPRSEYARLQEAYARNKLAADSTVPFPGRAEAIADSEDTFRRQFGELGLPPRFPTGFL